MHVVHPASFGHAIINTAQGLAKAHGGNAVATIAGGHALVFTGEAPNQDAARPLPMVKAHVSGYTRKDGTRVEHHERGNTSTTQKPAARPSGDSPNIVGQAARVFPAGDAKRATHVHFAGAQYEATGERGTVKEYGHAVRKFKHADSHLWLDEQARVHGGSARHAEKLRALHQAHVASASDSAVQPAAPVQATQAPAQPLAKGMPMLFRKVKATARRVDVSGLLGEMKQAQSGPGMLTKSHGPEIWAHGRTGAFA